MQAGKPINQSHAYRENSSADTEGQPIMTYSPTRKLLVEILSTITCGCQIVSSYAEGSRGRTLVPTALCTEKCSLNQDPNDCAIMTARDLMYTLAVIPYLMEVICLTTSAGECRSMRRLWILCNRSSTVTPIQQSYVKCWSCPSNASTHTVQ